MVRSHRRLNNIRIYYKGGGTKQQAMLEPPEKENDYPEPAMFGEMPAYGFFIRHVRGLEMNDVQVSYLKADARAPCAESLYVIEWRIDRTFGGRDQRLRAYN